MPSCTGWGLFSCSNSATVMALTVYSRLCLSLSVTAMTLTFPWLYFLQYSPSIWLSSQLYFFTYSSSTWVTLAAGTNSISTRSILPEPVKTRSLRSMSHFPMRMLYLVQVELSRWLYARPLVSTLMIQLTVFTSFSRLQEVPALLQNYRQQLSMYRFPNVSTQANRICFAAHSSQAELEGCLVSSGRGLAQQEVALTLSLRCSQSSKSFLSRWAVQPSRRNQKKTLKSCCFSPFMWSMLLTASRMAAPSCSEGDSVCVGQMRRQRYRA